MKIWVNTIVCNEENFIYFAIMSVIDYVDKVLIYDTGSDDKTVKIIEEIKKIKKDKIIFKQVGKVDAQGLVNFRQKMLEGSDCDWILLLDGDEIWWESSIKKLVKKIKGEGRYIDGIVVPTIIPVGDIYHIQEEAAGEYELLGLKGHFNLRAINKRLPGLRVEGLYPLEGFKTAQNLFIQDSDKTIFLDAPYLHTTHLVRSSVKRRFDKFKYELGKKVKENFKFPEVLYKNYPALVKSPWEKASGTKLIVSKLLTPLRKFKRRLK